MCSAWRSGKADFAQSKKPLRAMDVCDLTTPVAASPTRRDFAAASNARIALADNDSGGSDSSDDFNVAAWRPASQASLTARNKISSESSKSVGRSRTSKSLRAVSAGDCSDDEQALQTGLQAADTHSSRLTTINDLASTCSVDGRREGDDSFVPTQESEVVDLLSDSDDNAGELTPTSKMPVSFACNRATEARHTARFTDNANRVAAHLLLNTTPLLQVTPPGLSLRRMEARTPRAPAATRRPKTRSPWGWARSTC